MVPEFVGITTVEITSGAKVDVDVGADVNVGGGVMAGTLPRLAPVA